MSEISVDTKKLENSGQDILLLTKELNEVVDNIFEKIMSAKRMGVSGLISEDFIRVIKLEKIQYKKMINSLNKYGKILLEASEQYEFCIKKVR